MICDLIHFINFLDVSANNCFLFLEDSDRSIYLHVHVLFIIKVLEGNRYFIFTLLIEDNFEGTSVIANFKERTHWLLLFVDDSANDDNLIDLITIDFANIIRSWLGLLDHLEGDGCEDTVLSSLSAKVSSSASTASVLDVVSRLEASCATI